MKHISKFQFHKLFIFFNIIFIQLIYFYSTFHSRHIPRILGRRFALTATAYKYLDIGISVGPVSSVEMLLGDNKGNQIILPHATWEKFIARRADIEKLMQSTAPASLAIQDLVIDLVKLRDTDIVKLKSRNVCLYVKPSTILFLFTLEHCIEHVYFGLCQNTYVVNEKFKHFVTYLRRNCIIDKCDAANILRKICDKNSNVECELIAYALDNIVHNALHD